MAGDTSTKCGWRKAKSRNECNQYMLESGVASDITIKFPSSEASGSIDKDVPAHKYMLICMSPVFEAMLTGNYQEGGNGITILDVEPDIFMEVLKYIYYDGADLTGDNILPVLYAAKKYLVDGLVERCREFLETRMSVTNVCTLISHCVMFDERELMDKCIDFIDTNAANVFKSQDFLTISAEALLAIVSSECLGWIQEVKVFKACVKWAKHQQSKCGDNTKSLRDLLDMFLHEIRFARMSKEELESITKECPDILTKQEKNVLTRYTAEPCIRRRSNAVKQLGFNMKDRIDKDRAEAVIQFHVKNISELKDRKLSQPCYIRSLPWRILAMPKFNKGKTLGFFLKCDVDTQSKTWTCHATAELRLLVNTPGGKKFTRKVDHVFRAKEDDWGYCEFIQFNDLLDSSKGYVQDDAITLEVYVQADAAAGLDVTPAQSNGYNLRRRGQTP